MYALSLLTKVSGKPFNMLLVRPTLGMVREEIKAIRAMEGTEIIAWTLTDRTGQIESSDAAKALPWDSREFDSYNVSFHTRY